MYQDNKDDIVSVASMSDPGVTKVISIIANGGVVQSAVTGVKGSAESTYRNGYVEISPENLGLNTAVQIESGSGSLSEDQWKALQSNLSLGIQYGTENYKLNKQSDSEWIYENLRYSSDGKLVGSNLLKLNTNDLTYELTHTDIIGGVNVYVEEETETLVFGEN